MLHHHHHHMQYADEGERLLEADRVKEFHTSIHRFWQSQIEHAGELYKKSCGDIQLFWGAQLGNANDGYRKFVEIILRDYGAEHLVIVTMPEWMDYLDLLE